MFRMLRSPVLATVATAFVLSTAATPALATSPAVIYSFNNGPDPIINDGSYHEFDDLRVIPAGTWWVTVTATLDASNLLFDPSATASVTSCRLRTGEDTTEDEASWLLPKGAGPRAIESVYLTMVHSEAAEWVASFDCRSDADFEVDVSNVRITAVSGFVGSGSPRLVFASNSDGTVPANSDTNLGSMRVPRGRWFIVAKAEIASLIGASETTCRIVAGADRDTQAISLTQAGDFGSAGEIVVQTAHQFSRPGLVSLRCVAGSQPVVALNIHLVAIKAGKLQKVSTSGSTTTGTGTPVVVAGFVNSSLAIPGDGIAHTIVSMPLPAGAWLIDAKAQLTDASATRVECTLSPDGDKTDATLSRGGPGLGHAGLFMQAARDSGGAPLTVTLSCMAPGPGTSLGFVRLTAISAAPLEFIAL